MEERVVVVDDYCQKLADSGYLADQMKKVITGGLTGYERRRNSANRQKVSSTS